MYSNYRANLLAVMLLIINFLPRAISINHEEFRFSIPDDYTDQDLEIIMAMVDANYRYFEQGQEKFSKIIPTEMVKKTLVQRGNPPILTGFAALDRHSEDLSPQQIISQFGLDYDKTPYLANDGTKEIRQPFVFAIDTPMNREI